MERVKANYALKAEAIEDLEKLGEAHRWSRAKTIEALIEFYARVQMAVGLAEIECQGLRWEDGDPESVDMLDAEEVESAETFVRVSAETRLEGLINDIKRGLSPAANYSELNAGKSILEESRLRELEMKERKR